MNRLRWRAERFRRGGAAAATAVFIVSAPAYAADLDLTANLGVEESFSDNANLATDDNDRNSDLVSIVTPGVVATVRGGRVNGAMNYSHSRIISRQGTTDSSAENNLLASGQAELWNRVVFLDAQASISRQVVDPALPASSSPAAQTNNTTTTRAFNISPSFVHHFGTWAETRSYITYNQVTTRSDDVADTSALTENVTINSGRRFSRFLWSLTGLSTKTPREDLPTSYETSLTGNGTYVVNSRFSLLGSLGWQRIEDSTLDNQPKGPTWNFGFAAQPGQKSSLRLTYGSEDDARTLEFEGSYRLSARTSITASYNEQLQTSQQQIASDLSFLTLNPLTGELIDSRTGNAFAPGDGDFGLQNTTFRQRTFFLRINGTRRRNRFAGEFRWESRKTDSTGIEEIVVSTDLSLNRQISQRATGGVTLGYAMTDFGTTDQAEERELTFGLTYGYQILQDVQMSLAYNLIVRNVNNQDGDFYENAVTMGLSKRF